MKFRPLISYTSLSCLLAALALGTASGDTDSRPIERELHIMSRVLEESLGDDVLVDWGRLEGLSVFGGRIRAQYIPTVGAIFTIPVNIAISKPQPDTAAAEGPAADADLDLWDKYASKRFDWDDVDGPVAGSRRIIAAPGKQAVIIQRDGEDPDTVNVEEIVKGIHKRVSDSINEDVVREVRAFSRGFSIEYDEKSVERLRADLINALARYGRRLESMPPEERVILIIDAPKPTPLGKRLQDDGGQLRFDNDLDLKLPNLIWSRLGDTSRDRMMLAVPKAHLTAESTPESLASVIVEKQY
jgi:hypothetical protein